MTKFYDANPPYIKADADKVLCDGSSMTGLGGRVTNKDTAALDAWQEMTEEEALALVEDAEVSAEEALAELMEVLEE